MSSAAPPLGPDGVPASALSLRALASAVLRYNDGATFTYPDRDQYPHQWNWDSAFAAIGWTHIDPQRAYAELDALAGAQTADGMIPHIVYDSRSPAHTYSPDADVWGPESAGTRRRHSALTNPPVAAIALRYLFERAPDAMAARELIPRIAAWHRFLLETRDPQSLGEPVLIHPWESGRDNAVEWDAPMSRIDVARAGDDERIDLAHVSPAQRPTAAQYARCMALIRLERDASWQQDQLAATGPFRVLDPAFSTLLAAACSDLAFVAAEVGNFEIERISNSQARALTTTLLRRADDDGFTWPVDLVGGAKSTGVSAHLALQAMLPGLPATIAANIAKLTTEGPLSSPYGVCSLSSQAAQFESQRYWRGPVWANVTWLCALGLSRAGVPDAAAELNARLLHCAGEAGMREYFDPQSGEGLGARAFTWTAAVTLAALDGF